jgi:hypothetical protein
MNSRVFLGRSGFEWNFFLKFYLSGLIWAGAATATAQAQGIRAGAQLSGVKLGPAHYAYTLTLENTAASTSDIQMFWFGWEAGEADFLTSEPTSIQTPAGWTSVVEGGGADDGYSVQFVTFTTPLKPGSSVTFTFDSPDSPKIMAGPASLYPEYATLTSQVYSAHAADGLQDLFVAQIVSPPTAGLGTLGARFDGPNLVLTWNAGTNVVLQQSSSVSPANWTTVAGTSGVGYFMATNVSSKAPAFYRLATQ